MDKPRGNTAVTKMLAPALLILALISISAEAAKFYNWVDKDGVTHYSAQPPADAPAEGEAEADRMAALETAGLPIGLAR